MGSLFVGGLSGGERKRAGIACEMLSSPPLFFLDVSWKTLSTAFLRTYIHRVSKNFPPSICYNLDIHSPIAIIFDRSVTDKVRNQTMLCFPTSPI